jgi:hypothetical protein
MRPLSKGRLGYLMKGHGRQAYLPLVNDIHTLGSVFTSHQSQHDGSVGNGVGRNFRCVSKSNSSLSEV